ncbi:MAG: hypothetical protein NTZ18_03565 [Candidatus Komeilibacteria bacterium]|nr:hypothetical protein [Candidatus Komeilibacteria bacterium]
MFEGENFMPKENQPVHQPDQTVPEPEKPETNKPEQEINLEEIKNIQDLLRFWLKTSQETEDQSQKIELAYCIVKMKEALGMAKLTPEEVQFEVVEGQEGIGQYDIGYYYENEGKISLTSETLKLPPEHFPGILIHESIHAGKINHGRRVFDEGFCELLTLKILPNAIKGDYVAEKNKAGKVFDKGEMAEALEKYDFDKPLPLVVYYLGVEWKDRFDKEIKGDYLQKSSEASFNEDKYLAGVLKANEHVTKDFKQGVPDIYHKIKEQNLDFDQLSLDVLRHLIQEIKG